MSLDTVLSRLSVVRRNGSSAQARCPAHDDNHASLSISPGDDGGVVLYCHAGCAWKDVIRAAAIPPTELFATAATMPASAPKRASTVAIYDYRDADEALLFQVVRRDDKSFAQRRPDGHGGWVWNLEGVKRVLYRLPELVAAPDRDVIVVEGEKDADRLHDSSLLATTNPGGAGKWTGAMHAQLRRRKRVAVIPDNDAPGRAHALTVARSLLGFVDEVRLVELPGLLPKGDVSDWLDAGHTVDELRELISATPPLPFTGSATSVPPENTEPTASADDTGSTEGTEPENTADDAAPAEQAERRKSQATELVELTAGRFRILRSQGSVYAEDRTGPRIALPLRGSSGFRQRLASAYFEDNGRAPSASALVDALNVVEGRAFDADDEPVALRVHRLDDVQVVLDRGESTGAAVLVGPQGWAEVPSSPILFRRSSLTSPMPSPERGGSLDELRGLLNVTDESWMLLVSYLVAALLEDIPHAILLLTGEQGAGKTCAARFLVDLIDPSPAPVRSVPSTPESWSVAAAGSHVVCLDNLTSVGGWLSDLLCKAATGDGFVRRELYTNGDLVVDAFRRVVMLTSIDAGSLRGDLAERLIPIQLEHIDEGRRTDARRLEHRFAEARPRILGALLDLLADVLRVLPGVRPDRLSRMADFHRVCAAVDHVVPGFHAFEVYEASGRRIAADVVEDDPVARAVRTLAEQRRAWTGTASDVLAALPVPEPRPRGWPTNGQALSRRLHRATSDLAKVGVCVDFQRSGQSRTRQVTITWDESRAEDASVPSIASATSSKTADATQVGADAMRPPGRALRPPGEGSDGLSSSSAGFHADATDATDASPTALSGRPEPAAAAREWRR